MFAINNQIFELVEEEKKRDGVRFVREITERTYIPRENVNKRVLAECLIHDEDIEYLKGIHRGIGSDIREDIFENYNDLHIVVITTRRLPNENMEGYTHTRVVFHTGNVPKVIHEDGYCKTSFDLDFQTKYLHKQIKPRLNLIGWRMAKRAEMGLGR